MFTIASIYYGYTYYDSIFSGIKSLFGWRNADPQVENPNPHTPPTRTAPDLNNEETPKASSSTNKGKGPQVAEVTHSNRDSL